MKFNFLYFFLLFTVYSNSQNCNQFENWHNIILKEFPNIIYANHTLNEGIAYRTRKKIEYNLFSDKYFIPFTGKKFVEMSRKQRISKSKKFNCFSRGKLKRDELYTWMQRKLLYSFANSSVEGDLYWKVDWVNKVRKEYEALILKNKELSLEEYKNLKKELDSKYSVLLPSEVNQLKILLENQKGSAAKKELTQIIAQVQQKENSYNSLVQLANFERDNRDILSSVSLDFKEKVLSSVSSKITEILNSVLVFEDEKLLNIEFDNELKVLNQIKKSRDDFTTKYTSFMGYDRVKMVLNNFSRKKEDYLRKLLDKVDLKMKTIFHTYKLSEYANSLRWYIKDDDLINKINDLEANQIKRIDAKKQNDIAIAKKKEIDENNNFSALGYAVMGRAYWDGFESKHILKPLFRGDFGKIEKTKKAELFLIEFFSVLINKKSKYCSSSIPEPKLTKIYTSKNVNQYGNEVDSWLSTKDTVTFEKRYEFTYEKNAFGEAGAAGMLDILINNYKDGTNKLTNKMFSNTVEIIKFIQKNSCRCKSFNQMLENIYRFLNSKKSMQSMNIVPNGKACN